MAVSLGLVLWSLPASGQLVEYELVGTAHKDPLSDNLYGSDTDPIHFTLKFNFDASEAQAVAAGTVVNLPNHPTVTFTRQGHRIRRDQLSALDLSVGPGAGKFRLEDVAANSEEESAVFVLGPVLAPEAINIILGNEQFGYLEIGIPHCDGVCVLKGGLILDSAGPFGTINVARISVRSTDRTP
jgi:hypothetical protein